MVTQRPTQWPVLFDISLEILAHVEKTLDFAPDWSFGGGTALMIQIDHRESHDVDLFIDDPQILPFLNPETQKIPLERKPDSYTSDGTRMLKLAYGDVGEIDFICSPHIVDQPTTTRVIQGHTVAIETPAEIIAKKVYYRGDMFQPRDIFDLAAVVEHSGTAYSVNALRQCGEARCKAALEVLERAQPDFVKTIISQLMIRDHAKHLIEDAQKISIEILKKVT